MRDRPGYRTFFWHNFDPELDQAYTRPLKFSSDIGIELKPSSSCNGADWWLLDGLICTISRSFSLHFAANHNETKQAKVIRICVIIVFAHQLRPHIAVTKSRKRAKPVIHVTQLQPSSCFSWIPCGQCRCCARGITDVKQQFFFLFCPPTAYSCNALQWKPLKGAAQLWVHATDDSAFITTMIWSYFRYLDPSLSLLCSSCNDGATYFDKWYMLHHKMYGIACPTSKPVFFHKRS